MIYIINIIEVLFNLYIFEIIYKNFILFFKIYAWIVKKI